MTDENSILRFYKYSNDDEEIGSNSSNKTIVSPAIGSNLKQLFDILGSQGLSERERVYQREGGWSGDLYVIYRRLFRFQNEMSRFGGDSGTGGPLVANIYEVVLNSTNGWAQYLSLVLKGFYKEEVAQKLTDLDFAPKHAYLAKEDIVAFASGHPKELWLDDILEYKSLMPKQ